MIFFFKEKYLEIFERSMGVFSVDKSEEKLVINNLDIEMFLELCVRKEIDFIFVLSLGYLESVLVVFMEKMDENRN